MGSLIPGEALIYERDDRGNIYARYRDPPHNKLPRWKIGGAVDMHNQPIISYTEWQEILDLAGRNSTIKLQLEKLLNLYYIVKDSK